MRPIILDVLSSFEPLSILGSFRFFGWCFGKHAHPRHLQQGSAVLVLGPFASPTGDPVPSGPSSSGASKLASSSAFSFRPVFPRRALLISFVSPIVAVSGFHFCPCLCSCPCPGRRKVKSRATGKWPSHTIVVFQGTCRFDESGGERQELEYNWVGAHDEEHLTLQARERGGSCTVRNISLSRKVLMSDEHCVVFLSASESHGSCASIS